MWAFLAVIAVVTIGSFLWSCLESSGAASVIGFVLVIIPIVAVVFAFPWILVLAIIIALGAAASTSS